MPRLVQRSLCCLCGNDKVLALGLCATCYSLKCQDEEHLEATGRKFWLGMASVVRCLVVLR